MSPAKFLMTVSASFLMSFFLAERAALGQISHAESNLSIHAGVPSAFSVSQTQGTDIQILRNGIAVSKFENGHNHYLTTDNPAYLPGTIVLGDGWNCSTPRYRFLMPPPEPSPGERQLVSLTISIMGQGSSTLFVGEPELYIGGHYDGDVFVWGTSEGALPEAHTEVAYSFSGANARELITLAPDTNLHELNVLLNVTCGTTNNEYYVLERIVVDFVYAGVPDSWIKSYLVAAGAEQTLSEFDRSIADRWAERIGQEIFDDGVQRAIAFAESLYDLDTNLIDALLELPSVFDALFDFLHVLGRSFEWALFEIEAIPCSSYEISQVQNSIGPMADLATAWRDSLGAGCLPPNLSTRIASATQSLSGTITRLRTIATCMNSNRDKCEDCASLKIQALSPLMLFDPSNGQEQHGQGGETISYLPAIVEELTRQQTIVGAWAPTDVSASDGTFCDKVHVTWDAVTGATGYKVYRSASNSACPGSPIGTPGDSWFDDTTAEPGTTYYYSVKATSACGDSGCSSTNSGYRGSPPNPPNPSASTNTCGDKTLTCSGSPPTGVTWYWQGTSCGTRTDLGSCPTPYIATASGTYYIRARSSAGCWSAGCGSVTVTVNPVPVNPPNPTVSTNLCGDKTLTRADPPSGVTYYWQGTSCGENMSNSNPTYPATVSGTYYLRARSTAGCWSAACSSVSVTVNPVPVNPPNPTASTNACGDKTLTRSGSPPSGVTCYWQGTSCDERTDLGSGPTYVVRESGTYYIRCRSNAGCWSTNCGLVIVTVDPVPADPPDPIASTNLCGDKTLTCADPPSGVTYYWQGTSCGENMSNSNPTYPATVSGTYYLRARSTAGCWSAACSSVSVTVNPVPVNPPNPTASTNACGDKTLTCSGSPPTGVTWYWQGTSCGMRTDLGSCPTTYIATVSGGYHIRALSREGCWSAGCGWVDVTVNDDPLCDGCLLCDMNCDEFRSIIRDVPYFVDCVYGRNCDCPCPCCPDQNPCLCSGDCNCDGFLTIDEDVPCFVSCVYRGNCQDHCPAGSGVEPYDSENNTIGGAVYADVDDPLLTGIADVPVDVVDRSGAIVASTRTGVLGIWRVDGLGTGVYTIVFGSSPDGHPEQVDRRAVIVSEENRAFNRSIQLERPSEPPSRLDFQHKGRSRVRR